MSTEEPDRTALPRISPTAGTDARALPDAASRVRALEADVRRDLSYLDYPAMPWVIRRTHPSGAPVYDVVIVGAGQGRLATAFGLRREKIDNVIVLDRADRGLEGPWVTYARMLTLRSPKHVTGPDLGIPSLTPRAWYVATYGEAAWAALGKWPRAMWQAYLIWYRRVLALPVHNRTEVTALVPDGEFINVQARETERGAALSFIARKVVLATGIEGNGDWQLSDLDFAAIPPHLFAHTNWEFDVATLAGKRVAVLGAGASAFDTAASALEAGAAMVHQFVRRATIPTADPYRTMENAGFLGQFAAMSDTDRWRWLRATRNRGVPPTQDGIDRCTAFPNYALTPGVTWTGLATAGNAVDVTLSDGGHARFDFLVFGTGTRVDISRRGELAGFADRIALWEDRFTPPPGEEASSVWRYPYLGADLAFTEKQPGTAPFLRNIHNFTHAARANLGSSATALTSLKYAVNTLVEGLARFFWLADCDHYREQVRTYQDIDLDIESLHSRRPGR